MIIHSQIIMQNQIDNPDLHLNQIFKPSVIEAVLAEILGVHLTIITDLTEFDFEKNQLEYWVHLFCENSIRHPTTLSIYGIEFTLEHTKQLAAELNCQVITDDDPTLKERQWQLIKPDGSIEVVVLQN